MTRAIKAAAAKTAGFRTLMFNLIAIALIVADQLVAFLQSFDYSPLIPDDYLPWVTITLAVLNIVLRLLTTGPTPLARYIARWRDGGGA